MGKTSTMDPDKKAAHLLLHMSDAARKVCVAAGRDVARNLNGADEILEISRGRFAPDAIDSVLTAKFAYFEGEISRGRFASKTW